MNWETLSPDLDLSQGSSCNVLKDSVMVIGGDSSQQNHICPSTYLRIASFSLKTLSWEGLQVNSNGIPNRRDHAATTIGNSVLIFGGVSTRDSSELIGDVVTVTPTSFGIRCVGRESSRMTRTGHTACTFGDGKRAVIFGGRMADGSLPTDAWIYVPGSDAWIEVELDQTGAAAGAGAGAVPAGRMNHSATVCGDRSQYLVVTGGICPGSSPRHNPAADPASAAARAASDEAVDASASAAAAASGQHFNHNHDVSNEVWVLDLTAFIADAPPVDPEAPPVDPKGKKTPKGAPAGPVKPVATWILASNGGSGGGASAFECKFGHWTYNATGSSGSAGSVFRVGVLGGMSRTQPPASVNSHSVLEFTRGGGGTEFTVTVTATTGGCSSSDSSSSMKLQQVVEPQGSASGTTTPGAVPAPSTSSFGCHFVPLLAPPDRILESEEGNAAGTTENTTTTDTATAITPVAILLLNQSSVNVLELNDHHHQRAGSSYAGGGRNHSYSHTVVHVGGGGGKSAHGHSHSHPHYHRHSRELQARNASVGVRLWVLSEGGNHSEQEDGAENPFIARLRAQAIENERQAQLRANRGKDGDGSDGDAEDHWTGLFCNHRVNMAREGTEGDYFQGDVVYRDRGTVIGIENRPSDRAEETALIARLSDPELEANGEITVVRHGNGTLVRAEQRTEVTGVWRNDVLHGQGLLINRSTGLVYKGGFKKGKYSGIGKLYYGQLQQQQKQQQQQDKNQRETITELYDGEFHHGKRSGSGRLYSVCVRDKYQHNNNVGLDIIDNVPSTSYDISLSVIYDGAWEEDARSGHGTCVLPDGSTYTGCLLNNLPSGNDGVCCYADGSSYTGQWRGGRRNGFGLYTTAKQETYEGKWVNDQRCGRGVWKSSLTGEEYEGNWERHLPNGQGRRVYTDKNVYEGEFQDGLRHGSGTMTYAAVGNSTNNSNNNSNSVKNNSINNNSSSNRGGNGSVFVPASIYTGEWFKNLRQGTGKWSLVDAVAVAGTAAMNNVRDVTTSPILATTTGTMITTTTASGSSSSGSGSTNKPLATDAEISYDGEWYGDKRNGKGLALHQSGKTSSGIFENDYLRED